MGLVPLAEVTAPVGWFAKKRENLMKSKADTYRMVLAFTISMFFAPLAQAALYTYTYTGNGFASYSHLPYVPTDHVELQFTVDLNSNIDLVWQDRAADVTSFQIYDGQKWTTNTDVEFLTVEFSTDGAGAIGDWTFFTGRAAGVISTHKASDFSQDFASLIISDSNTPLAYVDYQPGFWTVAQVPLPNSIVLFVSGLLALANKNVMSRKKRCASNLS